jgi:hypothetical protein
VLVHNWGSKNNNKEPKEFLRLFLINNIKNKKLSEKIDSPK